MLMLSNYNFFPLKKKRLLFFYFSPKDNLVGLTLAMEARGDGLSP